MTTATVMKLDVAVNASECRILKRMERQSHKQLKRRHSDFHWDRARFVQSERAHLRIEQRYLYLAIAFLRLMDYKTVENTTREGNEPNPDKLREMLSIYGYDQFDGEVEYWLGVN